MRSNGIRRRGACCVGGGVESVDDGMVVWVAIERACWLGLILQTD
jgi:hypothetical protein